MVLFIRSQTGMAERLLAEHVDDGSERCRVCVIGGQAGRHRWPCTTYYWATEAMRGAPAVGPRAG